jgi:tetratricopeptide (TPR) repeat protein
MTGRRLIVGGAAAVLTAAALLLGGALSGESDGKAEAGRSRVQVLTLRGLEYQERVKETGDPSYYVPAAKALHEALELEPRDLLATVALGTLELSRHRFAEALVIGRRAVDLAPSTARGYGIVGDALLELGRYEEAFTAFNRMSSLKPSLSSYARISYARELLGDFEGAAEAMRLAADAAAGSAGDQAWAHVQLGKLYASHGREGPAARAYRAALRISPGYVDSYDALARIEAGRGRLERAIALERRAVEGLPHPDHFFTLGDLYAAAGNEAAAKHAYADARTAFRREAKAGANVELELALFMTDQGAELERALSLAQAARAARPSIDGDDVLAWALVRNDRCGEALHHSKRALRLGTLDALKFFHRGMVERCLGNRGEASSWFRRAIRLNPHFSTLWASVARTYLARAAA